MSALKQWALNLIDLWLLAKEKNLLWQQIHQEPLNQIRQTNALHQQTLEAKLSLRSKQLENELAQLHETHKAQLAMHKTKCKQDIDDYQQYLQALDQLKSIIQETYTQMPVAIVLTIHHHAKHLLNAMWEASSYDEKIKWERELINFMNTVNEETRLASESNLELRLPSNTLKLIHRN